MDYLLPIENHPFTQGFTTSESLHQYNGKIIRVLLSDDSLSVHKITKQGSHNLVTPPPSTSRNPNDPLALPKEAWEAFYAEGSINPSAEVKGGFGFYLNGPEGFKEALESGKTEAVMSYRMMLEKGWECVKGGKLPGICMYPFGP
jgi:hypothetical protein